MKNSRFYLLAAALVTLAACGSDKDGDNTPINEEPVAVKVTGSINNVEVIKTRAADNQWENDDRIGVSGTSGKLAYNNKPYKYNNSSSDFTPESGIIYLGATTGTFNAYHPYIANGESITKNIVDQEKTLDFLYAENVTVNRDKPTLALKFDHKMSLLKLHMEAGEGFTNDDFKDNSKFEVELSGVSSQATFNIKNGEVTVGGAKGISFRPTVYKETIKGQQSYYLLIILCPETIQDGITFSYIKDNVPYDALLTANDEGTNAMAMEPGKEYEYTVTVDKEKVKVSSVTINDWTAAWLVSKKVNASIK